MVVVQAGHEGAYTRVPLLTPWAYSWTLSGAGLVDSFESTLVP